MDSLLHQCVGAAEEEGSEKPGSPETGGSGLVKVSSPKRRFSELETLLKHGGGALTLLAAELLSEELLLGGRGLKNLEQRPPPSPSPPPLRAEEHLQVENTHLSICPVMASFFLAGGASAGFCSRTKGSQTEEVLERRNLLGQGPPRSEVTHVPAGY